MIRDPAKNQLIDLGVINERIGLYAVNAPHAASIVRYNPINSINSSRPSHPLQLPNWTWLSRIVSLLIGVFQFRPIVNTLKFHAN